MNGSWRGSARRAFRNDGWTSLLRLSPDPPEMGEAKTAGIFQAVAERAVDADMRHPDHRDGKRERRGKRKSGNHQAHRRHVAVRGIIDDGAWFRAREIGRKTQI